MRVMRSVRPPPPQSGALRTEKFDAGLWTMFLVSAFSVVVTSTSSAVLKLVVVVVMVVVVEVVEVVVVVDVVKGGV